MEEGELKKVGWKMKQAELEKGDVEEIEDRMYMKRKGKKSIFCCYRKFAFGNLPFSPTKQDRVGLSLQSRRTVFPF